MQQNTLNSTGPWWKFGHVWMVIAGPVVVILASFVTVYLAVTRPDPVISEDYYQQGININRSSSTSENSGNLAPALQARNHAATGVVPAPAEPRKQ